MSTSLTPQIPPEDLYSTVIPIETKDVKIDHLVLAFIPGTGNMGGRLAKNHSKNGIKCLLASRELKKAQEKVAEIKTAHPSATIEAATAVDAVTRADVIFFCPSGSLEGRNVLLNSIGSQLVGKIVVDVTNLGYFPFFADKWGQTSSTELLIEELKPHSARWVTGYKSTFGELIDSPIDLLGRGHGVQTASDDREAHAIVGALIRSLRLSWMNCGELKNNCILELMGPIFLGTVAILNAGGKVDRETGGSWHLDT